MAKLPIPTSLTRRTLLVAVALMLAAAAFGASAADAGDASGWQTATTRAERVTVLPRLEAGLLAQINEFRRSAGLLPAARQFGALGGGTRAIPVDGRARVLRSRIVQRRAVLEARGNQVSEAADGSWRVGENLVWSSPQLSARRALELWLNSPPHRQNLLTPVWREVGIAAVHASSAPGVYGGSDVTILTADFGVRH